MPPRGFVVFVVISWLASTGLLVYREIVPRWRSGVAPSYTIELTDEVGSPTVEWEVVHKDEVIGRGTSQIRRLPDRTFEMRQKFRFHDFQFQVLIARLELKRLESEYHVTREGKLLGIKVEGVAAVQGVQGLAIDLHAGLRAEVKDGFLEPEFTLAGQKIDVPGVEVAEHGSVLNPMHLLHRLPRLEEGQRWRVPLFDPMRMFSGKELLGQPLPGFQAAAPYFEAHVSAATLLWHGTEVPCLRISYREPGKEEIASTWVRRADGLVLAQKARQHGYEFTIRRTPS